MLATSLVWHGGAAWGVFLQLTEGWSGRFAVLLLCLVLVPNAAVWSAAYGLGPGFTLGVGHVVAPSPPRPRRCCRRFPCWRPCRTRGPVRPLHWAAALVPMAAGLTVGWFTGREATRGGAGTGEAVARAGDRDGGGPVVGVWSGGRTAATAWMAAVWCAGLVAGLAALAGGPLGVSALARFGPVWWQAGGAALVWTAGLAVPAALVVRVWRCRGWSAGDEREATAMVGEPRVRSRAQSKREPRGGAEVVPKVTYVPYVDDTDARALRLPPGGSARARVRVLRDAYADADPPGARRVPAPSRGLSRACPALRAVAWGGGPRRTAPPRGSGRRSCRCSSRRRPASR